MLRKIQRGFQKVAGTVLLRGGRERLTGHVDSVAAVPRSFERHLDNLVHAEVLKILFQNQRFNRNYA